MKHTLKADAKTDVYYVNLALRFWNKLERVLSIAMHTKLFTNLEFGAMKAIKYDGDKIKVPYLPKYFTYILYVPSKEFIPEMIEFYIAFVLVKKQDEYNSGLFEDRGIYDKPTIYIFTSDRDGLEYGFNQVSRRKIYEDLTRNQEHQNTFLHEFTHLLDYQKAQQRNRNPFARGYKEAHKDFKGYVNQKVEVNAMYSEWVSRIFDSLTEIDIKVSYFSSFREFWEHFWTRHSAGPELYSFSKPSTIKYLQKRLYKLYAYLKDSETPKPQSKLEAKKAAIAYLRKENADL